jgi:hypothetical protein
MNCAITSRFCHLNPLVEKRRKNKDFRLFSAEGNKRGLYQFSVRLHIIPTGYKPEATHIKPQANPG